MMIFLAIAVAAVGIATLVVALSFGKRTEKQVSAMLDRVRDSVAMKNETAINELRAELHEGLARLDWLGAGLPVVPGASSWPEMAGYEVGGAPEVSSPDPRGDGQV